MEFKLKIKNGNELECGTMFCIGRNYAKHAREMGSEVPKEPLVFLKPGSALVNDGAEITLPSFSQNVHHEVELVAIISKDCFEIDRESASDYILGYGVGIDFTLRDVQAKAKEKGKPWAVAKGFKGSAPISEIIPVEDLDNFASMKFKSPEKGFELSLSVNGELRQKGNTWDMERTVEELIYYLSTVFFLRKGDVIFTGTPEGVSQVLPGDKIEAELNGLVSLKVNIG